MRRSAAAYASAPDRRDAPGRTRLTPCSHESASSGSPPSSSSERPNAVPSSAAFAGRTSGSAWKPRPKTASSRACSCFTRWSGVAAFASKPAASAATWPRRRVASASIVRACASERLVVAARRDRDRLGDAEEDEVDERVAQRVGARRRRAAASSASRAAAAPRPRGRRACRARRRRRRTAIAPPSSWKSGASSARAPSTPRGTRRSARGTRRGSSSVGRERRACARGRAARARRRDRRAARRAAARARAAARGRTAARARPTRRGTARRGSRAPSASSRTGPRAEQHLAGRRRGTRRGRRRSSASPTICASHASSSGSAARRAARTPAGGAGAGPLKSATSRCVSAVPGRGVSENWSSGGWISPCAIASTLAAARAGLPRTSWKTPSAVSASPSASTRRVERGQLGLELRLVAAERDAEAGRTARRRRGAAARARARR